MDGKIPWETPAGNGMLGGRPQLTAGIRAGSYTIECSNLWIAASIDGTALRKRPHWPVNS
jgi:hypothetical protein